VQQDHVVLRTPLKVNHIRGGLVVLKRKGVGQANQGEALELDTIINSCDAEVVAKGTSDKGKDRGAIVRHGPYTLWGYAGEVEELRKPGRALFINTVYYAAAQRDQVVLERRMNKTRYGLAPYLKSPGLVETMRQYLPEELAKTPQDEIEAWIEENRPYLRVEGRRFLVDAFAKAQGVANHRRAYLERCIECLRDPATAEDAQRSLETCTEERFGADSAAWQEWFDANADYLYFSDCDGFRFLVDEEARDRGIPFEKLRGWSSEEIDYSILRS
jgi:hypothetical protein